jgi:hypothetical protein
MHHKEYDLPNTLLCTQCLLVTGEILCIGERDTVGFLHSLAITSFSSAHSFGRKVINLLRLL